MEKTVFDFTVSIDKDTHQVNVHCGYNEDDYDPEDLKCLKDIAEDFAKAIAVAYLKSNVSFIDIPPHSKAKEEA